MHVCSDHSPDVLPLGGLVVRKLFEVPLCIEFGRFPQFAKCRSAAAAAFPVTPSGRISITTWEKNDDLVSNVCAFWKKHRLQILLNVRFVW